MSAPNLGAIETPQEDIRNALAVLESCAVKLPTGLRSLTEEEYQAVVARCHRAVAKLEGEARK